MSTLNVQVRAADLAALMSGRLALLASSTLPGLRTLAMEGVAVWLLTRRPDGLLLHAMGPEAGADGGAAEALLPVPLPPTGAIAVLAQTEGELDDLAEWWLARSGQPAPLAIVTDAASAWPMVLQRVVQELGQAQARCVRIERSLAATRQDYEETRMVMASVSRTLGHRPAAPLTLALALEPSDQMAGAARPGARLWLRQALGRKLEGLAALALHVGTISAATTGPLRIRVFGEESDRIAGSWIVPMEQVVEGWLVLDLPTPIGPDPETALLEIKADVAGPHSIGFSLENKWAPPEAACRIGDDSEVGHALALRIWTARIGDRFVVPQHWDWSEAGSVLPRIGVPQSIALAERQASRVLAGEWTWLDEAAGRRAAPILGRATAILSLPCVTLAGADVLRCDWSVSGAATAGLRLGVWAADPARRIRSLDDLPAMAVFSGWRGAAADGSVFLTLPASLDGQIQLVLVVEGQDPACDALIEITGMTLIPTSDPAAIQARQAEAAGANPAETGWEPLAPIPRPTLARVELHQHLVDGRGYQHMDLIVHGVVGGGYEWPRIRFKIAINRDGPLLEFRRTGGWPDFFTRWPGTESDRFGPLLRVRPKDMQAFAAGLAHSGDAALIGIMLELLGAITAEGARIAQLDAEQSAGWMEAAKALGAARA